MIRKNKGMHNNILINLKGFILLISIEFLFAFNDYTSKWYLPPNY